MPSSRDILEGLTAIANAWRTLAIAWHAIAGAFLMSLLLGWRPTKRAVGIAMAVSMASVSVLAWNSGNPFNGTVFSILALVLAGMASRLARERVSAGPAGIVALGTVLVVFGWTYPHFLETRSWISYLYAAPLGLIPCPTLSAAIGLTLVTGLFGSRTWSAALATLGILYGLIGVFRLGVVMDGILLGGALWLAVMVARAAWTAPKRLSTKLSHAA